MPPTLRKRSPQKEEKQASNTYIQPKTLHFEFFGPHGAIFTLLGLPFVVVSLFHFCHESSCTLESIWIKPEEFVIKLQNIEYWNERAMAIYVGWILLHFVLAAIVPGKTVQGSPLPTPSAERLNYKINGFWVFVLCLISLASWTARYGNDALLWVANHFIDLAIAGIIFSSLLSLSLYLASFRSSSVVVAKGGNSGYPLYDLWMGRELNPRIFGLDLKYLCELRPGLIGWMIINLSFLAKQYQLGGRLTNSMILVNLSQGYYVFDALWNEQAILTTMDITTDGFGFMLVFGDLVWVPFTYTLQARYLSLYPQDLSFPFLVAILFLNLSGLYIFRSANSQKNEFRSNPNSPSVKHLKYIKTESGSKLLVSGWWGAARKINYTGT